MRTDSAGGVTWVSELMLAFAAALAVAIAPSRVEGAVPDPPEPPREFRAVFVTTAYNMDWPSRPGLYWKQQRREIELIVARAKALNCNVIIL